MAAYTTIDDPSAYFQTAIYTANGSTIDVVNDGNSDLQPAWLWFKCRNTNTDHGLQDSVRGASLALQSNTTGADADVGTSQITAFGSDGFSLASGGDVNTNTRTYVCWQWKTGTSFSNDASSTSVGTIDSAGSVNTDAGFSIQTWTGTGSGGTIAHGLSAVPGFMILKNRTDGSRNWPVYFGDRTKYMYLSSTDAQANAGTIIWNDTTPTSTVFSVGDDNGVNESGKNYVGYVFAEKQGYSKTGSYTGNGNVDGAFVYTGFKPAFILQKNTARAGSGWGMFDSTRTPTNVSKGMLIASANAVEDTSDAARVDFLSNGFKWRTTDNWFNDSGATSIFIAFAENPFVTSTGVPGVAKQ